MIQIIHEQELKQQVAEGLHLLDCYGTHCGPCELLAQQLELLDQDYPFLSILKLNSDESPEFCKEQNIMSVPTLFIYKDGKIISRKTGAQSAAALADWVGPYLYD